MRKLIKPLSSIKFSIPIIIYLAVVTCVGTIIESRLNALEASRLVYHSFWMRIGLLLLVINLFFVVVDRWPWKKKHAPFILAHFGIILLIFGALITQIFGLDGQLVLTENQPMSWFTIPRKSLSLFSSYDGEKYTELTNLKDLDLYSDLKIQEINKKSLSSFNLKILKFSPFCELSEKIVKSHQPFGASARFLLKNQNVSQVSWLVQRSLNKDEKITLGKAEFYLGRLGKKTNGPHMVMESKSDECVKFEIYNTDSDKAEKFGQLCIGEKVSTNWMGLEFQLINFYQHAEKQYVVTELDRPSSTSTTAIQVQFEDRNPFWLPMNDTVKIFNDFSVFILRFGDETVNLPLKIGLDKFEIEEYPGTNRASSYKSLITVSNTSSEAKKIEISMNEPAKIGQFTFYQASFEKDPFGKPIASVLSVNVDPGRYIKYLGSFLLSLGIILMIFESRNKRIKIGRGAHDEI